MRKRHILSESSGLSFSEITGLRPVQTGNVWRPNIIKHCLVTKHADVEVSGQTVKTCLIKHRLKLRTQRAMGHKLTRVTFSARDLNMAERETSQVWI